MKIGVGGGPHGLCYPWARGVGGARRGLPPTGKDRWQAGPGGGRRIRGGGWGSPPPAGWVPSCAEGGVLGILPGVVGTIQATETVKLIIGVGEPLINRFMIYDALRMKFRELKLRRDPECPVCGDRPTVTQLIDYEQFCGIAPTSPASDDSTSGDDVTVEELKFFIDNNDGVFLLDVREPQEHQICSIPGSVLIPLGELPNRISDLGGHEDVVVHCKSGVRSAKAVKILSDAGFKKVRNLSGGILRWIDVVDPSLPKY